MNQLIALSCMHPLRTLGVLVLVAAFGLLTRRRAVGRMTAPALIAAVGVLGVFLVCALSSEGSARTALVTRIKIQQASEGRLQYEPRWGVVDWNHINVTREHHAKARSFLQAGRWRSESLRLRSDGETIDRAPWSTQHQYRIADLDGFASALAASDDAERLIDEVAAAAALRAAYDLEVEQERASWTTGLRLSAWQREDLPSALFAVGAPTVLTPSASEVEPKDDWSVLVRTYALPSALEPAERARLLSIHAADAFWTSEDGSDPQWSNLE